MYVVFLLEKNQPDRYKSTISSNNRESIYLRPMIQSDYTANISSKLNLNPRSVSRAIALLEEGATIAFIARYRKDVTGNMDEVNIQKIKELLEELKELDKRKNFILKTIEAQGKMTEGLRQDIVRCTHLTALEDLYLPYKQKRKTRAEKARQQGLEPLAKMLMRQQDIDISQVAAPFVKGEIRDIAQALQGARDIIAEWMSERIPVRNKLRAIFKRYAIITVSISKKARDILREDPDGKKAQEINKYKDYFDFTEPAARSKSHRLLALFRGEKEGYIQVKIVPEEHLCIQWLRDYFVKGYHTSSEQVDIAITDAYKRLLRPAMETEQRKELKQKADKVAIEVFAGNLRELLLAPPVGEKRVLAIDPGFRTGCKVVCLNEKGFFLTNATVFPHSSIHLREEAQKIIQQLVSKYEIEVIGIGNGTAGRETKSFISSIPLPGEIPVYMVNEDGASIYSASAVAREEFPELDVSVRGAISIGRRLMDPLSELVKIDPKSIGVGQYQYDVDQKMLKKALDYVVESCVNSVGVHVNTASKYLLSYVSGLGPVLASNIIAFRNKNNGISSRAQLKNVPRMGAKAFQQCIGFLRVKHSTNPLDDSAVHPEHYHLVRKIARDLGCTVPELTGNIALVRQIDISRYLSESGQHTLKDIVVELGKPGRDPRQKAELFEFDQSIQSIEDLRPGLILPGIVTNVTNFGAFIDMGIKQNGLIHISNMADHFISDPLEVLRVNQKVSVEVLNVEAGRNRIGLRLIE